MSGRTNIAPVRARRQAGADAYTVGQQIAAGGVLNQQRQRPRQTKRNELGPRSGLLISELH